MRLAIVLLLFCATASAQIDSVSFRPPWDGKGKTMVLVEGPRECAFNGLAYFSDVLRDSLLSWWDAYKAEADSVHREWEMQSAKSDTLLRWIPARPTFDGFMEYLRRK